MKDALEIAVRLISCPSVTPKDEGAQEYLAGVLNSLGLQCWRLNFEGIDNLFARIGTRGPHFCFCGHTDVVPPGDPDAWSHPPFAAEIAGGKLWGRGAVDMKGAVAAFTAALEAFTMKHGTPNGSISFLITGDEEGEAINGTIKVLEWMEENGHVPDFALVGEPTNPERLGQQIKTGRRGSLTGKLLVKGVQGHVAYQHLADNPLPRMVELLGIISAYVWDDGSEWFQPTNLELTDIHVGNSTSNVIPASVRATFNIRFNDLWTSETLTSRLREILDEVGFEYSLDTVCGAESFLTAPCPRYRDMLIEAISEVTGMRPELTTEGGTSDARFVYRYCPVLEFGLTNETAHKTDENVKVDDLQQLTQIYLRLLEKFFAIC